MAVSHAKLELDYAKHCQNVLRSTKADQQETLREKAERINQLEKEYVEWFEYYLGHYAKSKCSWFHKKLARKVINNKVVYVILRVFRRGAKSVHANLGIPLFLYLVKRDLFYMLLIGDNEIKAKKQLSKIQAELGFNQKIAADYGKKFKHGDWADGDFTTVDNVHFSCLGIGQSPRGLSHYEIRPDFISVDDADTKKRSKNPQLVRELFEYIKEDVWGCYGDGNRRYIQCNNRFSKNTLVQLMSEHFLNTIEQFKQKGWKIVHHIIIAKAINDQGESGWPEAYSLEDWEKIRIEMGELAFEREMQDNPIEEGTVFKNEWIRYTKRLPLHQYDALVLYGDLSYKAQGDFKAMLFVGRKDHEYHVIAALVRRTTRASCAIWLYNLYESLELRKFNIQYKIEGSFAQDEFVDDFDAEGRKRGYMIPVLADKKSKANKHERIESMSPFFERGEVFFNAKEKESSDFKELENQLLAFEKGSSVNDDAPDCLQSSIDELNHVQTTFKSKTVSRKEALGRRKNRF